jgi:RNA polymerase sigma-70 factor (ECF subfamily)
MVRAVIGIARYRWRPGGLEPWLFGIARNVIADEHRRIARAQRQHRSMAPVSEEPLPHEPGELADEHAAVRATFEQLSDSDRDLLELRVIARLSVEQTAAVLGKRPGAVRTAQSRALARLRTLLEEAP